MTYGDQLINVTSPFLPDKREYLKLLDEIWARKWLTNHGPLASELEARLSAYLGVTELKYVTNGTIALQIAIHALDFASEVITTPFSYVATTSALIWEGCRPVMVDIDRDTLNIDPYKIEAAITPATTGILATHVFGNPCDVVTIADIARRHNLKVLYDGAHAFGSRIHDKSVFQFGDASTLSFHATKLFHTIEGGGIVSTDSDTRYKISQLRNFGHTSPTSFDLAGINGKASEFHAAMGLVNLPHIDEIIVARKRVCEEYDSRLSTFGTRPRLQASSEYNYAYYPLILESEDLLIRRVERLNAHGVFPRRYFYPSLSKLPYISDQGGTPIADDIASRILCLPLFPGLPLGDVATICNILKNG